MTRLNAFGRNGGAAAVWAAVIAVLLLLPGSALPTVPWWVPSTLGGWIDSLIHGALFLVQAWLLLPVRRAVQVVMTPGKWSAVCLAYAVALELLQIPVPGRSFQILDVAFAALGIGMAGFLRRRMSLRTRKRGRN